MRFFVLDPRIFDFIFGIVRQESQEGFVSTFMGDYILYKSIIEVLDLQHLLELADGFLVESGVFFCVFFLQPGHEYFHNILDDILLVPFLNFPILLGILAENPDLLNILRAHFLFFNTRNNGCRFDFFWINIDLKLVLNPDKFVLVDNLGHFVQVLAFLIAQIVVNFDITGV